MIAFGRPMRRRFLLERGTDFLNHGSFGTTPSVVLAAAQRWRLRMEKNPDRFLHATQRDIVFVENATSGVNAVLRSLEFRPGDEILATTHTYNAVRQTMREVCRRSGAKLVEARIDLPLEDVEALVSPIEQKITRRTKLVVLDHISSPTGLVFPVKRLASLARARGAKVLVAGAHQGLLPRACNP